MSLATSGTWRWGDSGRRPQWCARGYRSLRFAATSVTGRARASVAAHSGRLRWRSTPSSAPRLSGRWRRGLPPNRLPREVLDQEIGVISENRVEIRCDHRVEELDELFRAGYDAVFLAGGTCIPRDLEIAGEDLAGVWKG